MLSATRRALHIGAGFDPTSEGPEPPENGAGSGPPVNDTANGTYTATAGHTMALVICIAGAGAGGGATQGGNNVPLGAAGGEWGSVAIKFVDDVAEIDGQNYTVGSGGSGSAGAAGGAGGDTFIETDTITEIRAAGGRGGQAQTGNYNRAGRSFNDEGSTGFDWVRYNGGGHGPQGGGGFAQTVHDGIGGHGGASPFVHGGGGGYSTGNVAAGGAASAGDRGDGGGGGGRASNVGSDQAGGAGGDGRIIIYAG